MAMIPKFLYIVVIFNGRGISEGYRYVVPMPPIQQVGALLDTHILEMIDILP